MTYQILENTKQDAITDLFRATFTASEGEEEGKLVGDLCARLAAEIDNQQTICLGTYENEALIACIFLTRLQFSSAIDVYMLAPVAVSAAFQRQGIGQALINYGLDELRRRSVKIVVTYGDPAYYSKAGFEPLAESTIQAPLKLSMPFGWQGMSLSDQPIPVIAERPTCVAPFDNPAYW